MEEETRATVLPGPLYSCIRCGTEASATELHSLPSPRCAKCGFTVFAKERGGLVKQVRAV